MSVLAVKETMLYCPKCQQTYKEGTQRFCTNEGGRLLPAPSSGKSANQSGGVFTNLLGKVSPIDEIDKIFLLATSLSPDVKSVEDVSVKGELATILETFEPNRNF